VSALAQGLLVATAVGACALYSAWRLMPAQLRLKLLNGLGRLPGLGGSAWLAGLRRRQEAKFAAGCGGCAPTPGGSAKQTPGALRR